MLKNIFNFKQNHFQTYLYLYTYFLTIYYVLSNLIVLKVHIIHIN